MAEAGNSSISWLHGKLNAGLLIATTGFIILEIVALSPSSIEQPGTGASDAVDPELLIKEANSATLASGVPKDKVPDYTVEKFNYVSTLGGLKQWNLVADKAYFYHDEQVVHAVQINAYLFDPEGRATFVTGKEAKYLISSKKKDLEVFGDVTTRFPDGFETHSDYLRFSPDTHQIEVPTSHDVNGGGKSDKGQIISFQSRGLEFSMQNSKIFLPEAVHVTMTRDGPREGSRAGVPDVTMIDSDECLIDRPAQLAHFTMYAYRPLDARFVQIHQPDFFAKGRRVDLQYGDYSQLLQYMIAYEDVLIREVGKTENLRYGTAGTANFDTHRDVIVMREFPQVYQDNDTVTGDVITMHRDTDIVEVENSNAFSEGDKSNPSPAPSPANASGDRAREGVQGPTGRSGS